MLFANAVPVRRTHDLYALADLLNQSGIATPHTPEELACVNPYAVESRYGDDVSPFVSPAQVRTLSANVLAWAVTQVAL